MIIILCVDAENGMLFNHRRQSQDRVLRENILQLTVSHKLWMNTYSKAQFIESVQENIFVDNDFLSKAGKGDYCFVEDIDITSYARNIEKIILFKWNRCYPADTFFPLDLSEWTIESTEDLEGHSHKKITREIYVK